MIRGIVIAATLALHAAAAADEPQASIAPAAPIEEVLVTGQQPGPGLWRVTLPSAGNDHELWILGTHGPLPKKMRWRSADLEQALSAAQELIARPHPHLPRLFRHLRQKNGLHAPRGL